MNIFDPEKLRQGLEKIKALRSSERLPLLFARECAILGKILLDKEGNVMSNVASYYKVPYNSPDGGIAYKYIRKYPGSPIERVYKELVDLGVLGGSAWKYADFSIAKFYLYIYSINPKTDEDNTGLHIFVLRNRTQIESFRIAISSLIPDNGEDLDLDAVYADVSRAFDPNHPNSGFSINISKAANGKGLVLTLAQTNSIRGKSIELPDWYYETSLDEAWLDTSPDWRPTPEDISEHEELADQFRTLGLSGRLNSVAAERAYSGGVAVSAGSTPARAIPVSPQPVNPPTPPSPAPNPPNPTPKRTKIGLTVRQVSEVPPHPVEPEDPRAGGPNELIVGPDGTPVCFSKVNPDLPKCISCNFLKDCLVAS